ncbi:MAG: hypothetical protein Q8L55_01795 [Phycisphaerales bacterium]|nr:hypothetical protein [Phycisphaerales bacterium]
MQSTTIQAYNQAVLHAHQRALDALLKLLDTETDPTEIRRIAALLARFRTVKDPADAPPPRPTSSRPRAATPTADHAVSSRHAPDDDRGDRPDDPDDRGSAPAARAAKAVQRAATESG